MVNKNSKVLGRGLGNLLDSDTDAKKIRDENGITDIPLEKIQANPENPRKKFDTLSIAELAQTIREHGLLQPILVQVAGDSYMVISGERRLRACRQLGLKTVPCMIKSFNDRKVLEVSLIENIQREQLDAIEEAIVYKKLMNDYTLTQEDLAQKVGKNRATIANRVRLLNLPESIQAALADNRLSEGHARPLLSLRNEAVQLKIAREIERHGLSARQAEELVKKYSQPAIKKTASHGKKGDIHATALAKKLEEKLQTRVNIFHKPKGGGKIVIEYFSLDELERISKYLGK